jgi:hippurate hydrolase
MGMKLFCAISLAVAVSASAANPPVSPAEFDQMYPELQKLYVDLHQSPELSLHEQKTAERLVAELKPLGYEVTPNVGGYGVVAVLKNGSGSTVLLRTDTDALPVEEKTGLPFASKVRTADGTPVMHACGHDLHMSAWIGTAKWMAAHQDRWSGTLVLIAQPAEEVVKGARAMLADGLYTRFPKPNFALAIHDDSGLPAGAVGYTPGYALSNSDSIDITVFGKGGHGAQPQSTVDPIVIAARIVSGLQTLVSRQNNPLDPVVITVGQIHAGTKNNIIPDQAMLGLSLRTYKKEVRERVLAGIERVAKAEAELASAPRAPEVKLTEGTIAVYNDPRLTQRLAGALRNALGDANVEEIPPKMVSEDFSYYAQDGIAEAMFHVGAVDPRKYAEAQRSGTPLPSLHSALFAPDFQPTLHLAIETEVAELLELMGKAR